MYFCVTLGVECFVAMMWLVTGGRRREGGRDDDDGVDVADDGTDRLFQSANESWVWPVNCHCPVIVRFIVCRWALSSSPPLLVALLSLFVVVVCQPRWPTQSVCMRRRCGMMNPQECANWSSEHALLSPNTLLVALLKATNKVFTVTYSLCYHSFLFDLLSCTPCFRAFFSCSFSGHIGLVCNI